MGLLPPDIIYFEEPVSLADRRAWHNRAISWLNGAQMVFLDPDNGFEVKSANQRTCPKYSEYAEVSDYLKRGQAVVAIQFARQCDPIQRACEVRDRLIVLYGNTARLPVIRGRVAPNILFLTFAPIEFHTPLNQALSNFVENCGNADLIKV